MLPRSARRPGRIEQHRDAIVALAHAHLERAVDLPTPGGVQQDLDGPIASDVLAALERAVGQSDRSLEVTPTREIGRVEGLDRHLVAVAQFAKPSDERVEIRDREPSLEHLHQKSPRLA
ncbi:hypothetical protein EL22_04280 [Halostagnicola sp. A56]|nr:hypothetical protein EL22_04280 [Halostagnicola sp. A56]